AITPLRPANCGFVANWSDVFRDRYEGQALKRIALAIGDHSVRGEAIITRNGLEGGAVYALSAVLRDTIAASGEATLTISLRPDVSADELQRRLDAPRGKQSLSNVLRKAARLSPPATGLLYEAALSPQKLNAMSPSELVALIKAVPIRLTASAPIARAISTAG